MITRKDVASTRVKQPRKYLGDRRAIYNIARNTHTMMMDRGLELSLELSKMKSNKEKKIDIGKINTY